MYPLDSFDDDFFYNNIVKTNELFSKLLLLANLVCPCLAIFTYFGIFNVSYTFCSKVSILCLVCTLVQFITQNFAKNQYYVMYQGITFTTIYLCVLGINWYVGVNISYALIPCLSCLYFYKKATLYSCTFGYIFMLLSLAGKAFFAPPDALTGNPFYWWLSTALGFTFEYFFVLFFTLSISTQVKTNLKRTDNKNKRFQNIQMNLINEYSNSIEWPNKYSDTHIKNITKYVEMISRKVVTMGHYVDILTNDEISLYVSAVPLHDIGKGYLQESLLNKPARFTEKEFNLMKTHAERGYKIITEEFKNLDDPEFKIIASNMAKYHHERWDGKGYPEGISGSSIPLCARIMAAADVLDGMLSKRCYKDACNMNDVIDYFADERGKHFDPYISDAVITLRKDILKVIQS